MKLLKRVGMCIKSEGDYFLKVTMLTRDLLYRTSPVICQTLHMAYCEN